MRVLRPWHSMMLAAAMLALACSQQQSSAPEEHVKRLDPSQDDLSARVPHNIVVDFKDGTTQEQIKDAEADWDVDLEFNSIEGPVDGITVAVGVDDVDATIAKIRQSPLVETAEPLEEVHADYVPNDPDYARQWNFKQIHMQEAWEHSRGKGVIVAVIDTGIAYEDYGDFKQVPDLKGIKFVPGYDFVNKSAHANDDHGHGTHVAGTIAQATNNGQGVAGIAFEATLMPVKVLNHFGSGTSADIADAIRWATDHGAKVINMSLGGGGYSAVMANAVKYAHDKGVTVVCAAGNAGRARVEYPAAYPGAIAVSAVGPTGTRAPYSSYGKELDIAAPGGDKSRGEEFGILQNTIDPRDPSKSVYAYYQGTSMATPHVAGVAALLIADGAKTPDEVEKALFEGAARVGDAAWSEEYGHGILNAQAAIAALEGTASSPSPESVDWSPLIVGAAMLALVLLSISQRLRPGYLNILFKPSFLISLFLSTVGAFFIKWAVGHWTNSGAETLDVLSLPIPDWWRLIFGRGKLANPLFYSAAIPVLLSMIGIPAKGLRPMFAGVAIGFAGFLAYAAWSKAPALAYLPFTFLAMPWLVANTLVCLFVSRAMLRKERAR